MGKAFSSFFRSSPRILAAIAVFAAPTNSANAAPARSGVELSGELVLDYSQSNLFEEFVRLDPRGNEDLPSAGGEEWQTRFGLRVEPSCQTYEKLKDSRARFERRMEKLVASTVACHKRYPELAVWLGPMVSAFRRHSLNCDATVLGGKNYLGGRVHLSAKTSEVLFGPNDTGEQFDLSILAHELLHSSGADNHDHNDHLDSNIAHDKDPKHTVALRDRLITLQALCFKDVLPGYFDAMKEHGMEKVCVSTMAGTKPKDAWTAVNLAVRRSTDLPRKTAVRLCQRIWDDGHCLSVRKSQSTRLMLSQSEVQELQKQIRRRLQKVLPQNVRKIPNALLELVPGTKAELEKLQKNSCFTQIFNVSDSGDIFLRRERAGYFAKSGMQIAEGWDPAGYLEALRSSLQLYGPNAHCSEDHLNAVLDWIRTLTYRVEQTYDGRTYGNMQRLALATEFAEKNENGHSAEAPGIDYESYNDYWQRNAQEVEAAARGEEAGRIATLSPQLLLGDELIKKYYALVDRFHPRSPHFDCTAAGLTLFQSGTELVEALPAVRRAGEVPASCSVDDDR
jgi:hypothetical protein